MKTVAEIDASGRPVRVFHRNANSAWTHAPGERYRYRGGRHGGGWVEMGCPCAEVARSGAGDDGRAPGVARAATRVPREGATP